jgi:predicted dehydrogenase
MLLRFNDGARGMLWSSQVAAGNENNLRLRVYGEKAGLEWGQEDPNYLSFRPLGKAPMLIRRGGPAAMPVAAHASRIPSGHPEGYLEAFAQLYTDLAEQITAKIESREAKPAALLVPTVADGVAEMRFIAAAIESSKRDAAWVALGN